MQQKSEQHKSNHAKFTRTLTRTYLNMFEYLLERISVQVSTIYLLEPYSNVFDFEYSNSYLLERIFQKLPPLACGRGVSD